MTVADQIDLIQGRLFDAGVLWTRAELLDWYNDAYRDLMSRSVATRRLWVEDVPGRMAYAHSQEWETTDIAGTAWRFTTALADATRGGTSHWESEWVLERVSPTESLVGITQPWERSYTGETDNTFRFAMPKEHDKSARVQWDERWLPPVAVKQLDDLEAWHRQPGQPIVWTGGVGRNRSFELFELRSDYQQAYECLDAQHGLPRRFTGNRTYTPWTPGETYNAYAYSTTGDARSLQGSDGIFDPTSSVTQDSDLPFAFGARPYRFTMLASTDSRDQQGLGANYYGTQPWEIGNRDTPRAKALGIHRWENLFDAVLINQADIKPKVLGLGWQFTQAASTPANGFATQTWETEQLNGSTPSTVGVLLGLFTWEQLHGAVVNDFAPGIIRGGTSPDRQYWPFVDASSQRIWGVPRAWRSTTLSVMVTQAYVPEKQLQLEEFPGFIPVPLQKYLRYYVLARAFGRQGEGYRPALAQHYLGRFELGMRFFTRLLDVCQKDRDWTRQPVGLLTGNRPPRVRFPSTFPRVYSQ